MKPLVLYHAFCNDGFGAAFAAWKHFGPSGADYVPVQYGNFSFPLSGGIDVGKPGETTHHPLEGREVYILDFSFSQPMTQHIMDVCDRMVWLDHHKTAFENWLGMAPEEVPDERSMYRTSRHVVILDNRRSGALLAWDFFFPNREVPVLIKHLDDYDRWQFKLPNTKAVDRAIRTYDFDFARWDAWCEMWMYHSTQYEAFVKEGEAIQRFYARQVENAVAATKRPVLIRAPQGGRIPDLLYKGLAANLPSAMASDAGHLMAKESGTFGLTWYQSKDGDKVNLSFRSVGDFDVSVIAKAFGGGGHRSAAGASVPLDVLQSWLTPHA